MSRWSCRSKWCPPRMDWCCHSIRQDVHVCRSGNMAWVPRLCCTGLISLLLHVPVHQAGWSAMLDVIALYWLVLKWLGELLISHHHHHWCLGGQFLTYSEKSSSSSNSGKMSSLKRAAKNCWSVRFTVNHYKTMVVASGCLELWRSYQWKEESRWVTIFNPFIYGHTGYPTGYVVYDFEYFRFWAEVSKFGNLSRGWHENSLFNSYYTKV